MLLRITAFARFPTGTAGDLCLLRICQGYLLTAIFNLASTRAAVCHRENWNIEGVFERLNTSQTIYRVAKRLVWAANEKVIVEIVLELRYVYICMCSTVLCKSTGAIICFEILFRYTSVKSVFPQFHAVFHGKKLKFYLYWWLDLLFSSRKFVCM